MNNIIQERCKMLYFDALTRGNNPCGVGSETTAIVAAGTVDFINNLINDFSIQSIADVPCGWYGSYMYLINTLDKQRIDYCGYDINDILIERNRVEYPTVRFEVMDMTEDAPSKADLIICRDCLWHLSNASVLKVLANFKHSGATYLLASHQPQQAQNGDLDAGELALEYGARPINLSIEPYNLGTPIINHREVVWDRSVSLWKIN